MDDTLETCRRDTRSGEDLALGTVLGVSDGIPDVRRLIGVGNAECLLLDGVHKPDLAAEQVFNTKPSSDSLRGGVTATLLEGYTKR